MVTPQQVERGSEILVKAVIAVRELQLPEPAVVGMLLRLASQMAYQDGAPKETFLNVCDQAYQASALDCSGRQTAGGKA